MTGPQSKTRYGGFDRSWTGLLRSPERKDEHMNADAALRMGTDAEVAAHTNRAVVAAQQLGRRYGDGDTAVDALRSVILRSSGRS
jgi:hypothetical protein